MTTTDLVELRQYTLHPGTRETLVDVFDGRLVEPQEALGMRVVGQFRDLDRPDRFVWFRGFADMAARRTGLQAFYGGPDWAANRDVANATMVDFDDVRLLRAITPGAGFAAPLPRPRVGAPLPPAGLVTVTVSVLSAGADGPLSALVRDLDDALRSAGAPCLALLITEPTPNDYPALPVREDDRVVVRVSRFDDLAAHADHVRRAARSPAYAAAVAALTPRWAGPPRELRLEPTARSLLR